MNANLIKKLPDIFTAEEANQKGVGPYELRKLLTEEIVEKLTHGVYQKVGVEDLGEWSDFIIATKQIKQCSAICLISALVYHKLTEIVPSTVWLLVDNQVRSTRKGITLLRSREPYWGVGFIIEEGFKVTNLERTLAECLAYKEKIGYNETYYALKKALTSPKRLTTPTRILKMSKELGLYQRIAKQLEPFQHE